VYVEAATARIWQVAENTIGGSVFWDARLGYDIPLSRGTLELFANVNNLFDRDPPIVPGLNLTNQFNSAYDIIGRRYVMGVNLRF
jgi:outer membrane receptor protein involved in Fe transport